LDRFKVNMLRVLDLLRGFLVLAVDFEDCKLGADGLLSLSDMYLSL
jgi:hypothetical protein